MENLRSMWKYLRGLFGVFVAVLTVTIALFMTSCRETKEVSSTQRLQTLIIRDTIRDTLVQVKADASLIRALLECDSAGNVLLKRILEYEAGKHVAPPQLDIQDNILTATANVDSFGIFMTFRERYVERTDYLESNEKEIVYVNRLTGWQKFRVRLGDCVLVVVPVYIMFKCRKSIWQWIKKFLFRK